MEGRQGGDLDPGTGRDTQVTEAGGAFYLFIYFHRRSSCGMHGGAKESDGGVKIGGCDMMAVKAGLCQMFGPFVHVHTALECDPNLFFP